MPRRMVIVLLLVVWAQQGEAQSLRDKVVDLFKFGGGCNDPVCIPGGAGHGEHFNPAARAGQANFIVFLTDAIGVTAANVPISAASGGAVWGRSAEGLPVRTETSSGPIFSERGQTLGRGHFLAGITVTRFDYRSFRGVPLNGLISEFTHEKEPNDPYFQNDVIEVRTNLGVSLTAATAVLSYGLGNRIDVGVAIPLVRVGLDGTSEAQVISVSGEPAHFFGTPANPLARATAAAQGSASGIGDVAARIKIAALVRPRGAVALLGDVRFPTGKDENFLGSGATAVRGLGVVSLQYGNFSPHLNAGYVHRGGTQQNDAILATIGFDHLMGRGATLAGDLITEWQVGASKLALPQPQTIYELAGSVLTPRFVRPTNIPDRRDHLAVASLGTKVNAGPGLSLVANLLIPVRQGGLQPNIAWTGGLEYSF